MLCQIIIKKRTITFAGENPASSPVEGEWRMMLAAENLPLKFGRCFEGGCPDIAAMLLSSCLVKGIEIFQLFHSLCQRSAS